MSTSKSHPSGRPQHWWEILSSSSAELPFRAYYDELRSVHAKEEAEMPNPVDLEIMLRARVVEPLRGWGPYLKQRISLRPSPLPGARSAEGALGQAFGRARGPCRGGPSEGGRQAAPREQAAPAVSEPIRRQALNWGEDGGLIEDWFEAGDSQRFAADLVVEEPEPQERWERARRWVRSLCEATRVTPVGQYGRAQAQAPAQAPE